MAENGEELGLLNIRSHVVDIVQGRIAVHRDPIRSKAYKVALKCVSSATSGSP